MNNHLYKSTAISVVALAGIAFISLAQPASAQVGGGAGGPGGGLPGNPSSIMCGVVEAWVNGNNNVYAPGTPPFATGYTAVTPQTSVGPITEPTGHWEDRVVVTTVPSILAVKDIYFMNVIHDGSLAKYPSPPGSWDGSCNSAQTAADALAAQWSAQYSPLYYGGCPVQKENGC